MARSKRSASEHRILRGHTHPALTKAGRRVVEVNRPNRLARRMDDKSDRLDAEQIARAVLGKTSTATPKTKSGAVEVIRTLRVTRASAVKSRTQAFNTFWES